MKRTELTRPSLTSLLLLAVAGLAVPLSAQPRIYVVSDLGTFDGAISASAFGINRSGQAVGSSTQPGETFSHPFRTSPNAAIKPSTNDLGTLSGNGGSALTINSSGQVAGLAYLTGNTKFHAFRTGPNAAINPAADDLGTLGGDYSNGIGINTSGQVVGYAQTTNNASYHAYRTGPNAPINPATDDLGTLGGSSSEANAINDSGQVVGEANIASNAAYVPLHAFRTGPNASIHPATDDLGTLGGTDSYAFGINNSGQVAGYAFTAGDLSVHAFRTAPNAHINPATDDLETLGGNGSEAFAINNSGDVVGASLIPNDSFPIQFFHAFLFTGGVMYDLNNLLYAASGWDLQFAYGINDAGQIVGSGTHNGAFRAFRLDPLVTVGIVVNAGLPPPVVFNIDSEGAIPVAILGSATFDVTTIDPSSVKFGPKGAKNSRTPVVQDVNKDGKPDLVLYFAPHSAGIGCTDKAVALIGTTHSKQLLFTGSESIKTTHTFPCPR